MAMTGTRLKRDKTQAMLEALISIVASGSYTTGGDIVDFAPLIGYTNKQPNWVEIHGIAGYVYNYDLVNKKVLVFTTAATQIAAATYPAGVSGDSIIARVTWFL